MTKDEALKLALEALEEHHYGVAQIIIREALAQPEYRAVKTFHEGKPVYVAQQERENHTQIGQERTQKEIT